MYLKAKLCSICQVWYDFLPLRHSSIFLEYFFPAVSVLAPNLTKILITLQWRFHAANAIAVLPSLSSASIFAPCFTSTLIHCSLPYRAAKWRAVRLVLYNREFASLWQFSRDWHKHLASWKMIQLNGICFGDRYAIYIYIYIIMWHNIWYYLVEKLIIRLFILPNFDENLDEAAVSNLLEFSLLDETHKIAVINNT